MAVREDGLGRQEQAEEKLGWGKIKKNGLRGGFLHEKILRA